MTPPADMPSTADGETQRLILQATQLILKAMEQEGLSRSEFATRLGKSKGHISQILNGERNMTLRTLAEALHALNRRAHLRAQPTGARSRP
jgi:transcriptional regulator with XRE-family HTH domain